MKTKGIKVVDNFVTGDVFRVESFTKDWVQIDLDVYLYYKESLREEYLKATSDVKGLYAEIVRDRTVCLRFSEPNDAEMFANRYLFNEFNIAS